MEDPGGVQSEKRGARGRGILGPGLGCLGGWESWGSPQSVPRGRMLGRGRRGRERRAELIVAGAGALRAREASAEPRAKCASSLPFPSFVGFLLLSPPLLSLLPPAISRLLPFFSPTASAAACLPAFPRLPSLHFLPPFFCKPPHPREQNKQGWGEKKK